jgi:hypothetical protein
MALKPNIVSSATVSDTVLSLVHIEYATPQQPRSSVWQWFVNGNHDTGNGVRHSSPKLVHPPLAAWTSIAPGHELPDKEGLKARVVVMLVIFCVSLFGAYI